MTLVDREFWDEALGDLAAGDATLLTLWGEPRRINMAVWHTSVVALSSRLSRQPVSIRQRGARSGDAAGTYGA